MNFNQLITILIISFSMACNSDKTNSPSSHDHGPNGHSHGPSQPRTDLTIWTNKTELFVEYPVLVVGKPSRFAAHLTKLKDHQPLKEGQLKVTLSNTNQTQSITAEKPASMGIFKPTLNPKKSGVYTLTFDIKTPNFQDQIIIENVTVFNSVQDAVKNTAQSKDDKGITFLKEQAWKMKFQTVAVQEKHISDVIKTSGIWTTAPTDQKQLVATAKGIVNFNTLNLTKGLHVKKGQILMTITSKNLTADNLNAKIIKAKTQFQRAELEFNRKKILFDKQIITKSVFEKVEEAYLLAKTNYKTLKLNHSKQGKQIKAPFTGTLYDLHINNGDFVQEGDRLFKIAKTTSNGLEIYVTPSYANQLQQISNIWYQPKVGIWSSLKETQGTVQSVSQSVTPSNPLLTVYAQVNEFVEQPIGTYTEVHIATGPQTKGLVIPKEALLENYGLYSVIVQLSGERFERRNVTLGRQNGKEVEVLIGLLVDEVVVTTGAYQVKMASMSGQAPAHGHAH